MCELESLFRAVTGDSDVIVISFLFLQFWKQPVCVSFLYLVHKY